jgi:hypothetical protein
MPLLANSISLKRCAPSSFIQHNTFLDIQQIETLDPSILRKVISHEELDEIIKGIYIITDYSQAPYPFLLMQ